MPGRGQRRAAPALAPAPPTSWAPPASGSATTQLVRPCSGGVLVPSVDHTTTPPEALQRERTTRTRLPCLVLAGRTRGRPKSVPTTSPVRTDSPAVRWFVGTVIMDASRAWGPIGRPAPGIRSSGRGRRGRGRSVRLSAVPRDPDRLGAADPPGGHDLPELGQPLDRGVLVDLGAHAATGPLAVQVPRCPGPAPQPLPRELLVALGLVLRGPPGVVVVDGFDVVLVGDRQAGLARDVAFGLRVHGQTPAQVQERAPVAHGV